MVLPISSNASTARCYAYHHTPLVLTCAYGATTALASMPMVSYAICLRVPYAIPGSNILYAPTSSATCRFITTLSYLLPYLRVPFPLSSYAFAMRCPVPRSPTWVPSTSSCWYHAWSRVNRKESVFALPETVSWQTHVIMVGNARFPDGLTRLNDTDKSLDLSGYATSLCRCYALSGTIDRPRISPYRTKSSDIPVPYRGYSSTEDGYSGALPWIFEYWAWIFRYHAVDIRVPLTVDAGVPGWR
eukprot:1115362-Rhodomonas_salina.1